MIRTKIILLMCLMVAVVLLSEWVGYQQIHRVSEQISALSATQQHQLPALQEQLIHITERTTAWVICLALLVAVGGSLFFSRYLSHRLGCIDKVVHAIEKGDWTRRIQDTSPDALGHLARALDRMADARQVAAQQFEQQVNKTTLIMDHMLDALIHIDEKGTIQSFNPAAEQLFGYTSAEAVGENVRMLMPEPHQSQHDQYLKRYTDGGEARILGIGREVEGMRKDGSCFPAGLGVTEMSMPDGSRAFIGTIHDITERKRVEQMQRAFVSTVSHELRTPLTSIRGSLGLLMGGVGGELTEQSRELIGIAEKNSERLILLINDILDMEKIESGKLDFQFHTLSVDEMIEQSIRETQSFAAQHQVNIQYMQDTNHEPAHVQGDDKRLIQVMVNLLSNAVKFSPVDGVVEVRVEMLGNMQRVSVQDHGAGVPESFRSRIFGKFAQADASDVRAQQGTGLGLSIAQAIVHAHGGDIGFDSIEGEGTTFWFDMPIPSATVPSAPQQDMQGKSQVLIVEDDPDVAHLLALMMAHDGCVCKCAYTLFDATAFLEQGHHFDVITLDITMPDGNGLAWLKMLRTKMNINIPVIIVSAVADRAVETLSSASVCVMDWIQKPIDEARLKHALHLAVTPHIVSSDGQTPRILHVEDDADVAHIISTLLADRYHVVAVDSLATARTQLAAQSFDLVLLDIGLPDGSGFNLLPALTHTYHIPAVIFSAYEVDQNMASQVAAVLVKSRTSNDHLAKKIKSILQLEKKHEHT